MKPKGKSRIFILVGVGGVLAGGASVLALRKPAEATIPLVDATNEQLRRKYESGAGLCPWREPDADRKRFFPTSDAQKEERIQVSGKQVELTRRLGRKPTNEENVQPIFHVYRGKQLIGQVMTRRVRGENGAIELVLATDLKHQPIGLKVQRHREPEDLKSRFERLDFVQSCTTDSVSLACCGTGNEAIVREGVKTLRILLEEGDPLGR